jgi:hydrogenase maturation protease
MTLTKARCLILACGNTLRGDDGIGPWLAEWAEERFGDNAEVRVVASQQWTLELVDEVARAASVLFIDCSADSEPGAVTVVPVEPAADSQGLATHHLGASELMAVARDLYGSLPRAAVLLTVGAGSLELGEEFSSQVKAALPGACELLAQTVLRLIEGT